MRIGIISRRFWPYCGPLEVEAADVAQSLAQAGHQVEVLTIHWQKGWPRSFQFREVNVVRFSRRLGGPWGMFRYLRELNRYIRDTNFDVLIIYGLADESWAALRNFIHALPVCLRIDRLEWNHFIARRFHFRQKRFLNQLFRIWVDAPETAEALLHHKVAPEVIEVVLPYIQLSPEFERSSTRRSLLRSTLSDAHPILDIEPHVPLAVCGSNLDDEGIEYLLMAWKIVTRHLPKARLWILGEGNLQHSVWQRVCDLQLAHSIVMPGQFDELDDLLVAADLYLHVSISNWSCHSLARALSTGACVVAVENEFTGRWIEDQHSGLLVPPRNAEAMADAIVLALQDSPLRNRLGIAAVATSQPFQCENRFERLLEQAQSARRQRTG